jgi:hypothetical protein
MSRRRWASLQAFSNGGGSLHTYRVPRRELQATVVGRVDQPRLGQRAPKEGQLAQADGPGLALHPSEAVSTGSAVYDVGLLLVERRGRPPCGSHGGGVHTSPRTAPEIRVEGSSTETWAVLCARSEASAGHIHCCKSSRARCGGGAVPLSCENPHVTQRSDGGPTTAFAECDWHSTQCTNERPPWGSLNAIVTALRVSAHLSSAPHAALARDDVLARGRSIARSGSPSQHRTNWHQAALHKLPACLHM